MAVGKRTIRGWHFFMIPLLLTAPLLLLTLFSYQQINRNLTETALARRQTAAFLAANLVKERLDHLKNLGVSFATRIRFRELVTQGKWEEAAAILQSVPADFPWVERVFLADQAGTLMADTPPLPQVRGQNFAFRDWYRGVSASWEPYVSGIYKRTAEPALNVVAVAIPIFAQDGGAGGAKDVLGILVMQVRLDTFTAWSREINPDDAGSVSIVDQYGQAVSHPAYRPQDDIADFSGVRAVQKALSGEEGVDIVPDADGGGEQIIAYEPVEQYGWGVIVQQPARDAFQVRNLNLASIMVVYGIIVILGYTLSFYVSAQELLAHERKDTGNNHNSKLP